MVLQSEWKDTFDEQSFPDSFVEDEFRAEGEFFNPTNEAKKVQQTTTDETKKVQSCECSGEPVSTTIVVNKPKEASTDWL